LNPLVESAARPPGFSRFERDERIVERTRSEPVAKCARAPVGRMPLSVVPSSVNEPQDPTGTAPEAPRPVQGPGNGRATTTGDGQPSRSPDFEPEGDGSKTGSAPEISRVVRGSRWVDYDTHELLQMLSELEDERRWARLREGIWIAILIHLVLLSSITWIPKYIFKVPQVVDPF